MNFSYIFITTFLIAHIIHGAKTFHLKFTKVTYNNRDKQFATIEKCRLKAESRSLQFFEIYIKFLQVPITDVHARFSFKKRGNGYKPFLYDFVFRCDFIKRLNPVTSIVWSWFKDTSNLNHSCPFIEDFEIKRLENRYIVEKIKNLPVPPGDYALFTNFTFYNKPRFDIQFYGTITA